MSDTSLCFEGNRWEYISSVVDTFSCPRRSDTRKAEDGLKTPPNSQYALNALAIENPIEYAQLALAGEMQAWVDAEDCLEV